MKYVLLTRSERQRRKQVSKLLRRKGKGKQKTKNPWQLLSAAKRVEGGPWRHRAALGIFWQNNGGYKNTGWNLSPDRKMAWLKAMAGFKVEWRTIDSAEARREEFNEVKFRRHSLRSHPKCFVCFKPACHRHHVVPLKNGGLNCRRNCVSLCQSCHDAVHPWIPEFRARKTADEINAELDRAFDRALGAA